jgi:DNA-damage-inducible protein D
VNEISNPSPFDAIRRTDERGEYWLARELMPLMQYGRWDSFAVVVGKARASLALVQGEDTAGSNFLDMQKVSGRGPAGGDVRLTRFGAYLVAMAGDDTKPAVAQARIYFAVKAREAEVAPAVQHAIPQTYADALYLAADQAREIEDQRSRLAIAEPKAEYVDGFVNPDADASLIRVFAGQLGVGEKQLREWMVTRKLIYRRTVGQRYSRSKQRMEPEYQWLAHGQYVTWFQPVDQPQAPRQHNGQTATTLYVTPVGKVSIRRLLMKHPIEPAA